MPSKDVPVTVESNVEVGQYRQYHPDCDFVRVDIEAKNGRSNTFLE